MLFEWGVGSGVGKGRRWWHMIASEHYEKNFN